MYKGVYIYRIAIDSFCGKEVEKRLYLGRNIVFYIKQTTLRVTAG